MTVPDVSELPLEETHWFAMRATYRREMEAKKQLDLAGITNFLPMTSTVKVVGRTRKKEYKPAISGLLFVNTTESRIQEFKQGLPYLQYMMDFRSHKKIIIPEKQMKDFIAVAGSMDEQLLYLPPEELDLSKGTPVRILGGKFKGQEGIFMKIKGARDRRVVIAIQGVVAVALATVSPNLVEPLEKESKKI